MIIDITADFTKMMESKDMKSMLLILSQSKLLYNNSTCFTRWL